MVDYKKWDKFVADLSDEDDDRRISKPKVTILPENSAGKVTITPSGYNIEDDDEDRVEDISDSVPIKVSPNSASKADIEWFNVDANGRLYCWHQTELEVTLAIPLDKYNNIKGKDISIEIKHKLLSIKDTKTKVTIFSANLLYDVILNDNSDEDLTYTDWEIDSEFPKKFPSSTFQRVLQLQLRKKTPIPGVIMWWKCVFAGDPEVDVTTLKARNQGRVAQTKSINDTFMQAQKQFLQRMKEKETVHIDT